MRRGTAHHSLQSPPWGGTSFKGSSSESPSLVCRRAAAGRRRPRRAPLRSVQRQLRRQRDGYDDAATRVPGQRPTPTPALLPSHCEPVTKRGDELLNDHTPMMLRVTTTARSAGGRIVRTVRRVALLFVALVARPDSKKRRYRQVTIASDAPWKSTCMRKARTYQSNDASSSMMFGHLLSRASRRAWTCR